MNIREAAKRSVTLRLLALLIPSVTLGTQLFAADDPELVAGAVPGPEYRIAAEDVLQITVWKEDGLDKEVIVRPDGGMSFPLAGDVHAAGQTPKEVEAEIARRLARYIPDAVVTVSVKELKGMRIYVNGKVNNPGQFTVGRYVDVLQALTLAGGLNVYANADSIKILRRENGKEVVYKFDYDDVKNGKNLHQNIVLHADDVVVVP
jgi:polysaccharide export outer membrane protein